MESVGEVVVAEPDDGVLAGEDSFEQGQVGSGGRVEAGGSTLVVDRWSAQVVESFDGLAVIGGR
jgi:hypothetical protein